MLFSGTKIKLKEHIKTPHGALIPAGTRAVVVAVAREAAPAIYHCETLPCDVYEVEAFYCCDNHFELLQEVA